MGDVAGASERLVSAELNGALSLEEAVTEFLRAHGALSDASPADGTAQPFYRLRDVALATEDLVRALCRASGLPDGGSLAAAVTALAGADASLHDAVQTLSGLRNAHTYAFLSRPPTRALDAGRAAAVTVAAFLDGWVGDGYAPRGPR